MTRHWRVGVLALLALLPVRADEAALQALREEARAALERGDLAACRAAATRLLEAAEAARHEGFVAAGQLWLGEAAFLAGDAATAVTHYRVVAKLAEQHRDEDSEAYARLCLGLCLRQLRQPTDAVPALDRARLLYRRVGNQGLSGRAGLLAAMALCDLMRFDDAEARLVDASERLRQSDRTGDRIDCLLQLGLVASYLGRPAEAADHYREALALAREARDGERVSRGLNNLGMAALTQGDYAAAKSLLTEALSALPATIDAGTRAGVLANLAQVHQALGSPAEAARLYDEALRLTTEPEQADTHATILTTYANLQQEAAQYAAALDLLKRAEALRVQLHDELGLAIVRCNQANVMSSRGDLRTALALYLQALSVLEPAGVKEALGTLYNNLGRIYDSQGDTLRAVDYYKKCRDVARESGKPVLGALATNNAALALYNAVKPGLPLPAVETPTSRETRDYVAQARSLFEDAARALAAAGDQRYLATVYNNLGLLASDLGELDQAERWLQQSLDLHQRLGQRLGLCQTGANLGLVLYRQGHLAAARSRFQAVLELAHQLGDLEVRAQTLFNLALVEQQQGQADQAIEHLAASVALTEQRRSLIGGGIEQQRGFLAANTTAYYFLIEALLKAGREAEAFAVAERIRGRALLDMVEGGQVKLTDRLPAEALRKLRELEGRASQANLSLSQVAASAASVDSQLDAAREALETARDALLAEEQRLAGLYPDVAAVTSSQPLDVAGVAAALPADTALLQYVITPEHALLFTINREHDAPRLRVHVLREGDEPLADRIASFRAGCTNPRRRYRADAEALYRQLLKPALDFLPATVRRLAIVPDRDLFDCPFQALVEPRSGRFVADDYELVYASSASVLAASLKLGEERRAQPAEGLLLVADPDFGDRTGTELDDRGNEPARAALPPAVRGFRLSPLPGTREEATAIQALVPQVRLLAGREAQEREVREGLPRYRWLHFATHGLLDPEQPLYSAIALAAPADPTEDGFIEAREVCRLTLRAELVTLSACQTGRGKSQPGEGLIGLPWAFFVARVPTQIVSLWSVDDQMTKELMARFYRHLAGGVPKAAALRQAAIELRTEGVTEAGGRRSAAHPFYWAPFVVLGDWR